MFLWFDFDTSNIWNSGGSNVSRLHPLLVTFSAPTLGCAHLGFLWTSFATTSYFHPFIPTGRRLSTLQSERSFLSVEGHVPVKSRHFLAQNSDRKEKTQECITHGNSVNQGIGIWARSQLQFLKGNVKRVTWQERNLEFREPVYFIAGSNPALGSEGRSISVFQGY